MVYWSVYVPPRSPHRTLPPPGNCVPRGSYETWDIVVGVVTMLWDGRSGVRIRPPAGSRGERGKRTVSGIPDRLNYFVTFTTHT